MLDPSSVEARQQSYLYDLPPDGMTSKSVGDIMMSDERDFIPEEDEYEEPEGMSRRHVPQSQNMPDYFITFSHPFHFAFMRHSISTGYVLFIFSI